MNTALKVLAALLLAVSAQASILKTENGDKKVENVTVAKAGTVNTDGKDVAVGVIGAGLRTKKVLIANVKVYVAELLSSDSSKFVRNDAEALKSLELSTTIALRLNFVRSVEAEKVQVSFRDALTANSVDLKDPAIDAFLKAVSAGGEATEGKALTIVTQKSADGSEAVFYEDTAGKVTKVPGNKGLSRNIMSIWLGNPADGGIEKLKEQLIKGL